MNQPPILPESLNSFYGDAVSKARFLTRVQNLIFEYEDGGQRCILRLTPVTHRSASQVAAELDWVQFLAQNQAGVSAPIRSRSGQLCHTVSSNGDVFVAAAFNRAPGLIGAGENWNEPIFKEWGRLAGKLHRLSREYQSGRTAEKRAEWRDNLPMKEPKTRDEEIAMIRLEQISRAITALPNAPEDYGLIHADLHFWNFSVDGGRLTVFDFDNSEYHWILADIGTIIFEAATCFHQKVPRPQFIASFLKVFIEGYRFETDRDIEWFEHLPLFVKLREVSIFLILSERWRGRKLEAFQQSFFDSIRSATLEDRPFMQWNS